jgi:hypothetical protein
VPEDSDCAKKTKISNSSPDNVLSKTALRRMYPKEKYGKNVIDSLAVVDEAIVNYDLIAELLQYICTNLEEGAILVFLPGFKEITTAMEAVSKLGYFRDSKAVILYPLHSTLSSAEQTAIFQRPPDGKRKIGKFALYSKITNMSILAHLLYIPYPKFSLRILLKVSADVFCETTEYRILNA